MAKISPTKVKTETSQHKDGCYIAQRDMRAFVLALTKNWFILWQTSIMYFGKHDFLDWIISATIHLENLANAG